MPRMKKEEKREILLESVRNRKRLVSDQEYVKEVITKRLRYIPKQRLYKFRTCEDRNFDILKDNCIWMARAESFPDPFDNIINFNIRKNAPELEIWMRERYPIWLCKTFEKYFQSRGMEFPYTPNDFLEYTQQCVDKNGNSIKKAEHAFLRSRLSEEELKKWEAALPEIERQMDDALEKMEPVIRDCIKESCSGLRKKTLVYSMTERYDNPTLWENYAENYSGYCIEYSFCDFWAKEYSDYKNLAYLMPMTYCKRRPHFNMVPVLETAFSRLCEVPAEALFQPEVDADLNMQLLYKNADYSYEHEWRFQIWDKENNKQFFPFVSGLYAGKDITPENLCRLKEIGRELKVPVYQQKINTTTNHYEYPPIEEVTL